MDKPAFPMPIAGCTDGGIYNTMEQSAGKLGGMTLREYAAVAAMQGFLANASNKEWEEQAQTIEELAEAMSVASVLFADALLAKLEESSNG